MATATTAEVLAYIRENAELFAKLDSTDLSKLETTALRGDILRVIERKTTFSADVPEQTAAEKESGTEPQSAQMIFTDMLSSLAAEVHAGVKKSGTSGNHRLTVPTKFGHLTVELKKSDD